MQVKDCAHQVLSLIENSQLIIENSYSHTVDLCSYIRSSQQRVI